jgi:LysR family transcriptional regulator, regulator for metE and metH
MASAELTGMDKLAVARLIDWGSLTSGRPKLETRHLRLVLAVAREQSVTRAARNLNLSQSALSHQLLNLERDLDVELFRRVGKKMVPSVAAERLLEHAERILADLDRAERAVRAEHQTGRIPLRLTTSCYTHYAWLASDLARFGAIHPRIDSRIVFQETRHELVALEEDQVDLAITTRPPKNREFVREELFSDRIVAVLAKDHPLANRVQGTQLRWEHLAGETILIYDIPEEDEARIREAVQRGKGKAKTGPLGVWRVQLTEAIVELAKAHQGIGIVGPRLYRVLGHAPKMLKAWIDIAWPLRFDPLAPKGLRELMILRGRQMMGTKYEWDYHRTMATSAGVPDAKIDALSGWHASSAYTEPERAALQLAEEVTAGAGATEKTMSMLRQHFDAGAIVELVLTASFYVCVGRLVESLKVEPENKETLSTFARVTARR